MARQSQSQLPIEQRKRIQFLFEDVGHPSWTLQRKDIPILGSRMTHT